MNPHSSVSRRAILAASLGAGITAAIGVAWRPLGPLSGAPKLAPSLHTAMGAPLEISLDGASAHARAPILAAIRRVEQALSAFQPRSELTCLNQAAALDWTPASPLLLSVLEASRRAHFLTDGAFDPTVGPLLQAWGFRHRPSQPASQALRDLKERVGLSLVKRSDNRLGFHKDRMSLDFGGIAVGFAIDQAFDAAKSAGVRHGLINAAGDIRAIGSRSDGTPWRIGLRDPADTERVFAAVRLQADQAMTTSGTYEKFVDTRNGKVSHIFDPRTGESPREVVSATVLAPTAVVADAMATASVVLGATEALKMLEQTPNTEGILVVDTGRGRKCMATGGLEADMLRSV